MLLPIKNKNKKELGGHSKIYSTWKSSWCNKIPGKVVMGQRGMKPNQISYFWTGIW